MKKYFFAFSFICLFINSYGQNDTTCVMPDDITIDRAILSLWSGSCSHNVRTPNFVLSFELNCGKSTDHMVIFHTGDSHNASQLLTSKEVDIFIPHLRVGLDIPEAVKNTRSKNVLMSHVMELAHARKEGGFRWTFDNGFTECGKLTNTNCYMPVWGEKTIWTKKGLGTSKN